MSLTKTIGQSEPQAKGLAGWRLVERAWDIEVQEALAYGQTELLVICPFIQSPTAKRLLSLGVPKNLRVITRFNLQDFADGVSDPLALDLLLRCGAKIRGVQNLHSKVYVFGDSRSIVTSANLTEQAFLRNLEFGLVADDPSVVARCRGYFEDLWRVSGADLKPERLVEWTGRLASIQSRPDGWAPLPDEGVLVSPPAPPTAKPDLTKASERRQAFIKFFGDGDNREDRDLLVFDEVRRSGCHWACTYPKGKRPRQIEDGAIIYMARLVKDHNDTIIYGRAVAQRHEPGRDDASKRDLKLRPWKKDWPHYIRVHDAEFIAGTLRNGVSMNALFEALEADALGSTQENARHGEGNTNPRKSCRQQPGVRLSEDGLAWLEERLNLAFRQHGRLADDQLQTLDWPE